MVNKPKANPPAAKPMHWYRMDLQLHTPASADFKDKGTTYLQFLQKAEEEYERLAHEIKNPLAGVKASLEVLVTDSVIPAEDRSLLTKSIEQIKKIEALLKSLLNFARPPKPQFMAVDVNSVLEATISLAQRLPVFMSAEGKGVKIVKLLDPRIWDIMADPLQLQQVFMNLIVNAAEAMPRGGMVTVRSSYDPASHALQIGVSDTGEGVDPGMVDKIFQPFYTTKAKGTGLGLAITKRLIEQHGGTIRAMNNRDQGVTFLVTLPVTQRRAPAPSTDRPGPATGKEA